MGDEYDYDVDEGYGYDYDDNWMYVEDEYGLAVRTRDVRGKLQQPRSSRLARTVGTCAFVVTIYEGV